MPKVILPRKHSAPDVAPAPSPTNQEPIKAPQLLPAAPVPGTEHSERILLLEDEEQTNLVLKEYLQSFGYRVVAVSNGLDGLKEVIKSDFELVICDMNMPKLPGDMFYLAVQKTRPALCSRFVFITGHQGTPQFEAFISRTQAAVLVKPFRLQQLEVTLEGVLFRTSRKEELVIPDAATPARKAAPEPIAQPVMEEVMPPLRLEQPIPMQKAPPPPSMVQKALKMVGFLRKAKPTAPINPPQSTPASAPRSTRRISQEAITRRIPHLATAPVNAPTPPNHPEPPKKRITRRIPMSLAMSEDLRPKAAPPEPVAPPKVTRTISKEDVTIRVKDQKPEVDTSATIRVTRKIPASLPAAPAAKVTRSIPKVTRSIPKTARPIPMEAEAVPKVTRTIPKVTQNIPKVTRTIPKVTQNIPKVTRTIPKVTRNIPKVTQNIPKVTLRVSKADQETPIRLTTSSSHKVTRSIPNSSGDQRVSTAKN